MLGLGADTARRGDDAAGRVGASPADVRSMRALGVGDVCHHDHRDLERVGGAPQPDAAALPGSAGEHDLQCAWGTQDAARRFYRDQVRDRMVPAMKQFVARMELAFMATADARGSATPLCAPVHPASPRARRHPLGAARVPGQRGARQPRQHPENPHVGLLMVDFARDLIGLHVNGRARIVSDAWLRDAEPDLPVDGAPGRRARHWLLVEVEEAYVHCCKHIPRMVVVPRRRSWGSNDAARFRRRCVRSRAETSLAEPRHATTRNSADGAQAVRTVASGAVDRRRKSNRRSGLFMSRVRKGGRLVKQRMN